MATGWTSWSTPASPTPAMDRLGSTDVDAVRRTFDTIFSARSPSRRNAAFARETSFAGGLTAGASTAPIYRCAAAGLGLFRLSSHGSAFALYTSQTDDGLGHRVGCS
jgi:hypothetical protein